MSEAKQYRLTGIPAAPARRSSAVVLRNRIWLVVGSVAAMCALSVISLFAWLADAPKPVDPSTYQPQGEGLAEIVAQEYIAGSDLYVPLSGGLDAKVHVPAPGRSKAAALTVTGLSWAGYTRASLGSTNYEIHRFLLTTPAPTKDDPAAQKLLTLSVPIVLSATGPVLGADPTLGPASASSSKDKFDNTQFPQADVSGPVTQAISDWANAYAADDQHALYTVTGDTQAGTYHGLGGFTVTGVEQRSAVQRSGSTGNFLVVRARVHLASANGFTSDSDFDLLIGDYQTSGPHVLAWGPAGAGPTLTPYQNRT